MARFLEPEPPMHVSFNYLARVPKWEKEKPYEMWTEALPPGLSRSNVEFSQVENCELTDVRSLPADAQPTLDREGFEFWRHSFSDFPELSSIEGLSEDKAKRESMQRYLSTMTGALCAQFNGIKAVCFDWRVRLPPSEPSLVRLCMLIQCHRFERLRTAPMTRNRGLA